MRVNSVVVRNLSARRRSLHITWFTAIRDVSSLCAPGPRDVTISRRIVRHVFATAALWMVLSNPAVRSSRSSGRHPRCRNTIGLYTLVSQTASFRSQQPPLCTTWSLPGIIRGTNWPVPLHCCLGNDPPAWGGQIYRCDESQDDDRVVWMLSGA